MEKHTVVVTYEGKKQKVRYWAEEAENVRVLHIDSLDPEAEMDTIEVVVAKLDWYYISFPDMGSACPGVSTLEDTGLICDLVHDAGYWHLDVLAIMVALLDLSHRGF